MGGYFGPFLFASHREAENLGQGVFRRLFDPGFDGCWMDGTVACSHGVRDFVPLTGPYRGIPVFVDGPEYETIAALGSLLGIFDPHTVIEMNFYCDACGLDTISVGTATAFAMECFELGLIPPEATGGLELRFGNRFAALELLHQMARGEGFGCIVGEGVRRMKALLAERWGADPRLPADIGMEAKGLEFSGYMTKTWCTTSCPPSSRRPKRCTGFRCSAPGFRSAASASCPGTTSSPRTTATPPSRTR